MPDNPLTFERAPVEDVIHDRHFNHEAGRYEGPIESYTLYLEEAFEPESLPRVRNGRLVGETVVFGLPGTGDTGGAFELAVERAAELYANTSQEKLVAEELAREGTIALVRIETLGFPCGVAAGSFISVKATPLGDATDLRGGHLYMTKLNAERTQRQGAGRDAEAYAAGEVFAVQGNYARLGEDNVSPLRAWVAPELPTPPPGQIARKQAFEIRDVFRVILSPRWDSIYRTEIRFSIRRSEDADTEDYLKEIVEALGKSTPLHELVSDFRVESREATRAGEAHQVTLIPGLYRVDLDADILADRLRTERFRVTPRSRLHVVVNSRNRKIVMVGPRRLRRLLGQLTIDPGDALPTKADEVSAGGAFRVLAAPLADGERLDVSWKRFDGRGSVVGDGQGVVENDIGELLRYVYVSGCEFADCVFLLVKARDTRVLLRPKLVLSSVNIEYGGD